MSVQIVDPGTAIVGATSVTGDVAHDTVDSGNPVKIGAEAAAVTGLTPAVAIGDRTDVAADVNGRLLVLAQGVQAHDAVLAATTLPVLTGAYAQTEAGTLVAAGDITRLVADQAGRLHVVMEMPIAGENIALNVMRVVRGKLAVEQESWDQYNSALGSAEAAGGKQIKAAAGRVARVQVMNAHSAEVVVFVFNSLTASGTVVSRFTVPGTTGGTFGVTEWSAANEDGVYCDTGIFVVSSLLSTSVSAPASGLFMHVTYA